MEFEFQIESLSDISFGKNSVVELPNYFLALKDEEIANVLSSDDKRHKVLAVGREASAGEVILLTAEGNFVTLKPKALPEGRVIPSPDGKTVYFFDAQREYDSYSLITGTYLLR